MANKLYGVGETATTWNDTAATYTFALSNLASGTGRQGADLDLGSLTTARAQLYGWAAWVELNGTAGAVGEVVGTYLKFTDYAGNAANSDPAGDRAVSSLDKLRNLQPLKPIQVDQDAGSIKFVQHGIIYIGAHIEKVAPVYWNFTGEALRNANDVSGFVLWPIPPELQ